MPDRAGENYVPFNYPVECLPIASANSEGEFHACALIIVLVIAFMLLSGFRVAQQYERALVFRFGRFIDIRGPGLFWIIPMGVDRAIKVDMRVLTDGVEQQEAMTRDNVPVQVNAVIWYRIVKPDLAIIEVQNVRNAVIQVALTTLRNVIGQHSLDDVLKEREKLSTILKERVDFDDRGLGRGDTERRNEKRWRSPPPCNARWHRRPRLFARSAPVSSRPRRNSRPR